MIGLVIGGTIGAIILLILIKMYRRTGKMDAFGTGLKCPNCGRSMNTLKCPYCNKTTNRFDIP